MLGIYILSTSLCRPRDIPCQPRQSQRSVRTSQYNQLQGIETLDMPLRLSGIYQNLPLVDDQQFSNLGVLAAFLDVVLCYYWIRTAWISDVGRYDTTIPQTVTMVWPLGQEQSWSLRNDRNCILKCFVPFFFFFSFNLIPQECSIFILLFIYLLIYLVEEHIHIY